MELERGSGTRWIGGRSRGSSEGGTRSAMAVSINSVTTPAVAGLSLFDHAERVGIAVPTSCNKQGKCRECIVEVTDGAECLSVRAPEEKHLGERFRLSCR